MALPILLIPLLYFIDRLTKNMAVGALKDQEDIMIIKNVLQLRYVENRGAAFGMLQDSRAFFIIITLIVTAGVTAAYIKYARKSGFQPVVMLFYSLLIAGAFGNLYDRVVNRYVVDFIYVSLINFPVFNVADIYITCGCVMILLYVIMTDRKNEHTI